MDDIDRFLSRQAAQAAPEQMDEIDQFLARQRATSQESVRAEAEGEQRRAAIAAREKELYGERRDRGAIERTLAKEFPRTESQVFEDWGKRSAAQRFVDSAGHQLVRGAHNVANKVDNFISNRFGDDVEGGGIIDDAKFAERDRKNDLLAEQAGAAGAAGRFVGDSLLTAPVDAVGGRVLRPLGKRIMASEKGQEWAREAKAIQVRKARADARAAKTYTPTDVSKAHSEKIAAHDKAVAKAQEDLKAAENAYGPLRQEALAAEKRAQLIEDTWRAQRGPRGNVMDHMDDMFAEQLHKDPTLRALSGMDDLQFQANSMTRHLKGWQDTYRDGRRAYKKAEKDAADAYKTIEDTTKFIEDSPSISAGLVRARNKAMADQPTAAQQAKAQAKASREAAETYLGELSMLGPKPRPSMGRRTLGRAAAGHTLSGAAGGAGSAAILADEGQSLEAARYGAALGAGAGVLQGAPGRLAIPAAAVADKGAAVLSYTRPKVQERYALRKASSVSRKYKQGIVGTLEAFSDNVSPGGLQQTISKIRDVSAGREGAEYVRDTEQWEEQRQQ